MAMLISGLFLFATFASPAPQGLEATLKTYQKSTYLEVELEKKVISEVMGTEKVYLGKAILGPRKFRFASEPPEKTLVVFDGSKLWSVQFPAEGASEKVQAAEMTVSKKSRGHLFLMDLLKEGKLLSQFDLKQESKEGNEVSVEAKPKASAKLDIQSMRLKFDTKKKRLLSVEYLDDLGNKTIFNLKNQKKLKRVKDSEFQFKPGADVEVINL